MWLLGGAFLLTSGLVYFGFFAAWLNVFLLIGALLWVRLAVGCVALASGAYNLHAFATDAAAECKVANLAQRRRIIDALCASVYEKRFLLAVAGIVMLAVAVNLIELLCSAGIPAVFTDVLARTGLPSWQRYLYLLLYNAVYVVPLLLIMIAFVGTLGQRKLQEHEGRALKLMSGLMMLALGLTLIFVPQALSRPWFAALLLVGAVITTWVTIKVTTLLSPD